MLRLETSAGIEPACLSYTTLVTVFCDDQPLNTLPWYYGLTLAAKEFCQAFAPGNRGEKQSY